jgi:hypothetical protein
MRHQLDGVTQERGTILVNIALLQVSLKIKKGGTKIFVYLSGNGDERETSSGRDEQYIGITI